MADEVAKVELPDDTVDDGYTLLCPWCGSAFGDLWEFNLHEDNDSMLHDCDDCGKRMRLTARCTTTLTATAVP